MQSDIIIPRATFSIGQRVHHRLFNYRGVVVDIDASFREKEEFYEKLGTIKPERDKPWYRVLVHETSAMTYVAEEHLRSDVSREEIDHPALDLLFDAYEDGRYHRALTLQ